MGEKKKLRKQRAALDERIKEHRGKISREKRNPNPDNKLIRHWEREIANWKAQVAAINRKLRK